MFVSLAMILQLFPLCDVDKVVIKEVSYHCLPPDVNVNGQRLHSTSCSGSWRHAQY